eukprot:CAMPEP_0195253160 /NCGR_PEP_ID=MMETSP0706-20130129/4292_1 /TAXON_ID=33640 /ORGANISM="Asterionellopsis glacialis, Strain CCMP134" /LENGTH=112 /DNA_ID=CAMNT_0040305593 /DNA_START=258 /DNA_END=596 /DNA_ORIENTATION=-
MTTGFANALEDIKKYPPPTHALTARGADISCPARIHPWLIVCYYLFSAVRRKDDDKVTSLGRRHDFGFFMSEPCFASKRSQIASLTENGSSNGFPSTTTYGTPGCAGVCFAL